MKWYVYTFLNFRRNEIENDLKQYINASKKTMTLQKKLKITVRLQKLTNFDNKTTKYRACQLNTSSVFHIQKFIHFVNKEV